MAFDCKRQGTAIAEMQRADTPPDTSGRNGTPTSGECCSGDTTKGGSRSADHAVRTKVSACPGCPIRFTALPCPVAGAGPLSPSSCLPGRSAVVLVVGRAPLGGVEPATAASGPAAASMPAGPTRDHPRWTAEMCLLSRYWAGVRRHNGVIALRPTKAGFDGLGPLPHRMTMVAPLLRRAAQCRKHL